MCVFWSPQAIVHACRGPSALTILSQLSPSEKKFEEAIGYYSRAIELNPYVAVYYGNRSFAYLKMESYGYALIDASKALELDRTYIKVSCSLSALDFSI